MAASFATLPPYCSIQKRPFTFQHHLITFRLSSNTKLILRALPHIKTKFLNAVVDSAFQFVDQLVLPSQTNFAPVEELGEAMDISDIEGHMPDNFPDGVYIRNGS
ncbi:uncharacterized protein LOC111241584 [Vigna radiata var. radiata]|uniref:Uncharacterized protein LOC111241584 n=1 Tax=Vigna radiata var. radiata TaxID=3916 RepID=A0A3Q0EXR8_VIGRR|nr:uncharacterized protein LOC111241584 [Vigna radiata var. radiata]